MTTRAHKRTLLAAAACAVVTLGTVLGGGSSAAAPASPPVASDGMVAAMQRDLGLTEAQAVTRLRQEAVAIDIGTAARSAAGAAYGGEWFDQKLGKLVVGVAADESRAAAVRSTGAVAMSVPRTEAQLDAAKATVDAYARKHGVPAGVTGWHTDVRTGALVVSARPGADTAAFVAAARTTGPVAVEESAATPRTVSAGTVGGDPYYINGNTRCSIGFSVQGGFVSAGHCGGAGSSVVGWDGSAMGSFAGSSFPGNDYSFIRIGNGWWTAPVVLGWGTVPDQLVRGSGEAPVGSSICRSGSTTHWHCGTVLGKGQAVAYPQGTVYEMTKTNVCAEPGDSGGSFITGDQAQGVTSGGWGNCGSGGETWFQPVNEILAVYGLSLVTA